MNIWCKINDYQQDITYIISIFIYKSPTYSQDSRKSIESKKYAICVRDSTYLVYLVYFGSSRRGHEGFMHAELAEFAEGHIASLVLAMRDILQCPPESGGREPQARRGYANGGYIVCYCLKYDYSNIVVETYPFPALRRYFP